jgi:uncharacterized membrane protein YbhN (UPF0104 family)/tRNA A-37 threonylcarbamoyl transferase component Bud32
MSATPDTGEQTATESRYFVPTADQPRARRASDAVAVGVGLFVLIWSGFNANEISTVDEWVLNILEPLPTWFDQIWKIGYLLGFIMVVALFIGAIAKRRWELLRDMTLAVVITFVLAVALSLWISDTFPTVLPEVFRIDDPELTFPIIRVAVMTAVIIVAAPHLATPVRRLGWLLVALVAVSGFGLGFGYPSDALGAVGLGMLSAGGILLVFGSPKGYPDVVGVRSALSDLGVEIDDLTVVPDQSWGVRRLAGSLPDGTPVQVLAYGRDASDSRMAAKAWRSVWYRESDRTISFSRLEAVEHEALAMLMAKDQGVSAQVPLAVGIAGEDVAVLARTANGSRLTDPTHEQLVAVWREVAMLHESNMAHGTLMLKAVTIDGDRAVLGDFVHASFSATEAQRSVDIVSLLYETGVVAGGEEAVSAAMEVMPAEELVTALAYMQVPALTPAQRKRTEKPKALLRQIREAITAATDADVPDAAKLRRIRPKDLIMPALSLIAMYALLGMLTDIDFAAVWDVVRDAIWILIVIGFFIGQIAFLFEATGMLFATGYPLPMKPLVVLQLAVKWIGLAIPSAAGRITMNTLFLRKYGVPPTIAVTQGAIDGLSGFVVEALILLVAFIAVDIPLDIDTGDVRWGAILLIVVVIIVGTVIAVFRIHRLRDVVIPVVKDAWGSLSSVLTSPKATLGLLGSNLASRLILASTLWFILQAIGEPLPFITCLVVTVATNLLAGLVPIPGGIGVAEAVLTSFLVLAGLGENEAFAAAVVFRIATFYIPAGEGFFATKWLEDGDYI